MNADEPAVPEDPFTALFLAGEDALVAGAAPESAGSAETPADLRGRLQRDLECVRLLQQVLGPPAPVSPPPAPGLPWARLGRFEIRRELGRGGFGIVYLAHDPVLGREVALKVPRAEVAFTPELRERFHREARAAAGLDHPNLVTVHEAGEVGPVCFLVSAYCPGVTLARWLREHPEPVPFGDAARLVAALAEGAQHAHARGVIHRDLKPANILLTFHGEPGPGTLTGGSQLDGCAAKITDFGLAKLLEGETTVSADGQPTQSGAIVGTAAYMAPEQASGRAKEVGPAADVYALGAILYELLTGRPPFRGETNLETLHQVRTEEPIPPARLRLRLPRDLETICLKCLHKEPPRRYASAGVLAAELGRFLRGEPIQARAVGRLGRGWRWCRRNPRLAVASGLAAAGLLAAVGLLVILAITQSLAAADLHKANEETKRKATTLLEEQERLRERTERWRAALRLSAGLAEDRALMLGAQGEASEALHWLAQAVRIAPEDDADLQRALRTQLAAWMPHVHTLRASFPSAEFVRYAGFTPAGAPCVLTASRDWAALQLHVVGRPIGQPLAHKGRINGFTWSPDARRLLTGSEDGTARLWDAATGDPVGELVVTGSPVFTVAFSADGKALLTTCTDKTVRLWETATGKSLGPPISHLGMTPASAFSADGKTVYTRTAEGITCWDVPSGNALRTPIPSLPTSARVAFCPGGRTAVSQVIAREVRLWRLEGEKPTSRVLPLKFGHVRADVVFTPDGKSLLTLGHEEVQLWDTDTGALRGKGIPMTVGGAAVSPDGKFLLTSGLVVRLLEAATGQAVGPAFRRGEGGGAIRPDGKAVLTIGAGGTWLWDVAAGRSPAGSLPCDGKIQALAVLPDGGSFLAVVERTRDLERTVRRLEMSSLTAPGQSPRLHEVGQRVPLQRLGARVVLSPQGKNAVVLLSRGGARLYDLTTGKSSAILESPTHLLPAAAFSPDGRLLLVGGSVADKNVVKAARKKGGLWLVDAATGRTLWDCLAHREGIQAVAISPDGKTFLTLAASEVQRWDLESRQPLGPPWRHARGAAGAAFSPDGTTVVTWKGDILRWDVATGRPQGKALADPGPQVVAFSPDGRLLLAGGSNGEIRLWDVARGKLVGPPLPHSGGVTAVAFHPDGKSILTAGNDGVVRRWPVPAPVGGTAEQVLLRVQVATGTELDGDNLIGPLDASTWQERRRRLGELGERPR